MHRDCLCPSVDPSKNLNVGYDFAISLYFFINVSNYIAYDNMDTLMSNSSGQGHNCLSLASFLSYSDKASEDDTSVQLNSYLV